MSKYIFIFFLTFSLLQSEAQIFYAVTGVNSNLNQDSSYFVNSNRTYQMDINNCDSTKIYTCLPTNANNNNEDYFYLDIAIDASNNLYWVTSEGNLYTRKLNDTTSCQPLGVFDSNYLEVEINALVTDVSGNVLAIGSNHSSTNLYEYERSTKRFLNLGSLPTGFYSAGDLFFYEGKLFWTSYTGSNSDFFLEEITIANPSQSCYYMSLKNLNPYAAFSIQNGTCSEVYIISAGDTTSTLYKLDLYSKTISPPLCTYPFVINGAASVYNYSPSIIDSNNCFPVDSNTCTTMPVTLLNFTSALLNKTVKLQWQTATEINSNYFVIERSSDGINFSGIGKVNAAGNSNSLKQYSFLDNNPLSVNYYRLKEADFNGSVSYSKILQVNMPQSQALNIIGNPVQHVLQLQINASSSQTNYLSIFDFSGRRLKTFNAQNGVQNIDVSFLNAGSYVLQMITADGEVYDERFIKIK